MINMYFTKMMLESVHGVNGSMLDLMETVGASISYSME